MASNQSSHHTPTPEEVNRANQLNPDHDAYWQSRGQEGRPSDDEPAPAPSQEPGARLQGLREHDGNRPLRSGRDAMDP